MKIPLFLSGLALWLVSGAIAQNPDCRQTWMPPDAPAFCAWQAEPSLPEERTYHAVTVSGNNVYVLGGFRYDAASARVIYYDSVVRTVIAADGRLGSWAAEPSFKTARSGAAAAVAGNCLFLAGGSSSTATSLNYYDDIQHARIGADGRISNWTSSPHHLKVARSNLSLVAVTTDQGTFLHAVAGVAQIGADTVHLDTIEVAKVSADCSVGAWAIANYHIKGGRSTPQALVVRNNVVVIGGWGDFDLIDVYNDVQMSAARPDGTPSPFRTASAGLTTGIYGHATVLAGPAQQPNPSMLLSIGGQPGTGAYANWISYAYLMPAGPLPDALGLWRIAPSGKLPAGRAGLGAAQAQARLYVIGGNDASGQYYKDVQSARFDFGRP